MLHMFHLRLDPSEVHTQSVEYRMHTVSVKYVIWDITFLSVSFLYVFHLNVCVFSVVKIYNLCAFFSSGQHQLFSQARWEVQCVCEVCMCMLCDWIIPVCAYSIYKRAMCLSVWLLDVLFVCLCAMCLCMCSKYAVVSSEASLRTPSKQSHSTSIHTSKADRELMQWSRTGRLLKCNHTRSDRPCCSLDAEFNPALIWLGRLATDPSFAASNSLTL